MQKISDTYIVSSKHYRKLLRIYNVQYNLYSQTNIELMLLTYNNGNSIIHPECYKYPMRMIDRRHAFKHLVKIGYMTSAQIYHYSLTAAGIILMESFIHDFNRILKKQGLKPVNDLIL